MSLGSVNITLRPVRLAFLVDPVDTRGIKEAIELNTFLWGGMFNPIVPVYRRTPKKWQSKFERTTAREISEGLIRAFDPDYVVLAGRYSNLTINVGHRDVIKAPDVLGKVEEDGTPGYGIGLFEILSHFELSAVFALSQAILHNRISLRKLHFVPVLEKFRQCPVRKSTQPRPFVFIDRIQLENRILRRAAVLRSPEMGS